MMLLTGQPLMQNGMPQSMQRAPWIDASSSVRCSDELAVVLDALLLRLGGLLQALVLQKSGYLAHRLSL